MAAAQLAFKKLALKMVYYVFFGSCKEATVTVLTVLAASAVSFMTSAPSLNSTPLSDILRETLKALSSPISESRPFWPYFLNG